jgi:hypothetical protein
MSIWGVLLVIIASTFGSCALISLVGGFATVPCRLKHKEEMFTLNEKAKLNAIEIDERKDNRYRQLTSGNTVAEDVPFRPEGFANVHGRDSAKMAAYYDLYARYDRGEISADQARHILNSLDGL